MTPMMRLVDTNFEITIINMRKDLEGNINSMSENMEKSQKINVNSRKRIKGIF